MPRLTQPALGLLSAAVVVVVSLAFVSLFSWPTFGGWVSVGLMCAIPTSIVLGGMLKSAVPAGIAARPQPLRGMLFLLLTAAVAVVVAVVHLVTIGGRVDPPVPMLAQAVILSVIMTFWLVIVWGGWPFSLIRNPLASGAALLVGAYVLNAVLFHLFYDYAFLKGAPVYHSSLDPHGAFDAWDATVFAVTLLAVMFLMLHLDLWPLPRLAGVTRQPVLGIVWTAILVVVGGAVFFVGTRTLGIARPVFLVRVPIPFIFGSVLLLNTLQGSLFSRFTQPRKGILSALVAAAVGSVLAGLYVLVMPLVTGSLPSGAPAFDAELWLANALLAVTFPFLAFHGDYFGLWPFAAPATAAAPTAAAALTTGQSAG